MKLSPNKIGINQWTNPHSKTLNKKENQNTILEVLRTRYFEAFFPREEIIGKSGKATDCETNHIISDTTTATV